MLSVFDQGPPTPPPSAFNLAAHVLNAGQSTPDKTALAVVGPAGAERWSFTKLTEAVLGTATGLLNHGLTPGDRILMRLENTVDFPIACLGAIAAGLVPAPTSAQWTAPEATKAAGILAPKAILAAPGMALPDPAPCPVIGLETLRGFRTLPAARPDIGDPNRPAYIVFTSGTSGTPRAVIHAHRAIWARRMMHDGWYGLTEGDRLLHAGAFNWTFTLGTGLMDPWSVGATALVPEAGTDPAALPLLLRRHDVTLFAAAPGILRRLLRAAPDLYLPKLRHGLVAGEKCPEALRSHWQDATGTPLHEAYGMSECSTFISGSPARPAREGTLGYPQTGRHIAILGSDHRPVPMNTPGSIAVGRRDPGLMLGYLSAEDATAARMQNGFFLTGDHGSMDERGAVTYLGREDDMMNAGGVRVSPIEVEAVLNDHPGVVEAACAEVTVKADTRIIAAFYSGPERLDHETLAEFCKTRLAGYKAPRMFIHVAELPKGANGKLRRRALREGFEERHPYGP